MHRLIPTLLSLVCATTISAVSTNDIGPCLIRPGRPIAAAVAGMTGDAQAVGLFRARGLDVLNLTWEDTGRWQNSAVGPNISDLTIQALDWPGLGRAGCMPVVRRPNFADVTCDVPLDSFRVLVGNEHGADLRPVSLRDYLARFGEFQHSPTGFLAGSLLAERDRVALTSAQACFLPIPAGGEARFAPVLFNYQSSPGSPAVLAILVTPEGTSAQVIDNNPVASAGASHGQRLFHNRDGQRAALRGTRFSDFQQQQAGQGQAVNGDADTRQGLSLCLVVQVPLVVERRPRNCDEAMPSSAPAMAMAGACEKSASDVETAVVQAGPAEGPWIGLNGCTLRRDTRFPIRVTVQFYQATSSAAVTPADVSRIGSAIDRIYLDAEAVGSLVVDGWTGRATEHQVAPVPAWPQPWWQEPCQAWQQRTGQPWSVGIRQVRERLGTDWQPRDARELGNALAMLR